MTRFFNAFARPCLDYCAAAWQPYLSPSSFQLLERAQNRGLRTATGQLRTTPVEALRLETASPSYSTISKRLCLTAYEKSLRLPHSRDRLATATRQVNHRLKRPSWRLSAAALATSLPQNRLPLPQLPAPPWTRSNLGWTADDSVPNLPPPSAPAETRKEVSLAYLSELSDPITIYTDGSASDGTSNGGAAAVICAGPPNNPRTIQTLKSVGATTTSSFEEELRALNLALTWISNHRPASAAICTDSQALIHAVMGSNRQHQPIRDSLDSCSCSIHLQWIPSHYGIPGNELADAAAKAPRLYPKLALPFPSTKQKD